MEKIPSIDIDPSSTITLVISKQMITEFDFSEIYPALMSIKSEPRKYFNRLFISIHGYDDDSREVYQIAEIRDYIQFLDKCFPYWFYFLNRDIPKKLTSHRIIMTCVCQIDNLTKHSSNIIDIQFNIQSIKRFIM